MPSASPIDRASEYTPGGVLTDVSNVVYWCDALALLRALPDASVDAVVCDPPYGLTHLSWEVKLDWAMLFGEMRRVLRTPNSPIALFAQQPFTTDLINAWRAGWRYELIWHKTTATGFLSANERPLRSHEHIQIFAEKSPVYNPQFEQGEAYEANRRGVIGHYAKKRTATVSNGKRYPTSVWRFALDNGGNNGHPTAKPVGLVERLIQTLSNPGDLILDPFLGSGTTAIAARNTGRRFIGCDITREYVELARRRLAQPYTVPMFE